MQLTKALPHIRLCAANEGKLAALDALWEEYQSLCQRYAQHFCSEAWPDGYAEFVFDSPLSARWQRVAVMQAAGIAQSWRSNHRKALAQYQERFRRYEALKGEVKAKHKAPEWKEWKAPEL
ncbi:MAG TPA: hypothetical protein VKQ72_22125, partial [Aggregatilineales bacterium]|nr:hypothetical protein [Aggregatilineales bacterium]